jgi:anti-anti-sigma factor
MRVQVTEPAEGVVLAVPIGDVDLASAPRMLDRLLRLVRDAPPVLVVALDQVEFMDSSGLNALVAAHRRAEVMGTAMRVAAPSPVVRKLFHLTGLDRHFDSYDDVKDALTPPRT